MDTVELSAAHRDAVNRRRRVIDQEDANMPVDALGIDIDQWLAHRFDLIDRGAPVDAIFWDIGFAEDTYAIYNNSKLLPPLHHPGIDRWREQGIDWVAELVKASHRRGIEAFWSHRICPVDFSAARPHNEPDIPNPLKQAHPDWINACWWPHGLWNLASHSLREHKIMYFRELFELYDLDGLQIDFARHTPCLPPGHEWENREHATDFLRQVRLLLQEIGQRKNKPLLLAVRVAENVDGNHRDGFEVERWAAENLVDIFVLGGRTTNVDIAGFRRITAGKIIKIYPCFDGHHTDDGYYFPPVEHFRGVFSNWSIQGADGIGIFNWTCAREEEYDRLKLSEDMKSPTQREALFEMADLSALAGKTRRYAVERRGGYPWAQNYLYRNDDKPLPQQIVADETVSLPVIIHIPNAVRAELTLILWQISPAELAGIEVNGHRVEIETVDPHWRDGQIYCDRPQPTAGAWRCYPVTVYDLLKVTAAVPPAALLTGNNTITVSFKQPKMSTATLEKAEITLFMF